VATGEGKNMVGVATTKEVSAGGLYIAFLSQGAYKSPVTILLTLKKEVEMG